MCMCEIGVAAAFGTYVILWVVWAGCEEPKFCNLTVNIPLNVCIAILECLASAYGLIRTPVKPESDGHQSRFARCPEQIWRCFFWKMLCNIFTVGTRQIVSFVGLVAEPLWIKTWRGLRSFLPRLGAPETGYGAFEFAIPKKGYGAFFLIGLVGEGVQEGRLRCEIGASISRL